MATWLKQSTAVEIVMGPFLDETDGKTAETLLTITQPDIRLKKNGGAWGQKNAAQTLSHEENGWYEVSLDTTDTNTLGILIVAIHESGALPVWREFMVVAANIYDSFIGGGDVLDVSVTQVNGTAINNLVSGRVDASVGAMAANTLTATAIAADAITDAKVASDVTIASVTGAVGSVTGNVGGNVVGSVGSVTGLTASDVGAIKAKTDSLTFTVAGQVDANIQSVNDVTVNGNGAGTPWGP